VIDGNRLVLMSAAGKYDGHQILRTKPSDYCARNFWVVVSFPSPGESAARHELGSDRFIFGSDYPDTRQGFRRAFAGPPRGEFQQLLAGNAAGVQGFDLEPPAPLAARVGPTFADLSIPYVGIPEGNRSPAFNRA
jgi:hypothetical protein